MIRILLAVTLGIAVWDPPSGYAEDWPQFRGPTGQGISAEKNLPLEWSTNHNLAWKASIPGEGWSSPIVLGSHVFVTTASASGAECRILCLDRDTGKILWNRHVLDQVTRRKEGKNSYATPTPVTDGERVCAVFGDGSVVAVNLQGEILWTNRQVEFYSRHGLGASPIIYDGLMIMPYDGSNRVSAAGNYPQVTDEERLGWQIPWDRALIVALDTHSGKRVWTATRGKSRIAHITPLLTRENGQAQIVSCAGDAIQGFDPKTGERLWTVYSRGEGVTPSPAMGEGLIFTSSGFEKTTLRTVRTGGKGDVTSSHIAWEQPKGAPTLSSLLYVKPFLYSITDGGIAHCYKADSGDIVYSERVGGSFSASPLYAEGRIYFLGENGQTTVIEAGSTFKVLARNPLYERCQASMAVSNGRLFIRTEKHLWCINGK